MLIETKFICFYSDLMKSKKILKIKFSNKNNNNINPCNSRQIKLLPINMPQIYFKLS
jgi:hypothetical protein